MKLFVFGYGSLINRMSIARTIVRVPDVGELTSNRLRGYARLWDYKATVRSELLGRPIEAVYLNLRLHEEALVNGATFAVSSDELAMLQKRERFYDMIECSELLEVAVPGPAYTFVCTDAAHIASPSEEGYVLKRYVDIVREGCSDFGTAFTEEFERTTLPPRHPLLDGAYSFL